VHIVVYKYAHVHTPIVSIDVFLHVCISQAQKVAVWDNQLRENQKAAISLADTVHRLYENQEQLRR
jgi:hypothetical protein